MAAAAAAAAMMEAASSAPLAVAAAEAGAAGYGLGYVGMGLTAPLAGGDACGGGCCWYAFICSS